MKAETIEHAELRPTHHCFDDALDYLGHVALTESKDVLMEHVLVHAICLTPTEEAVPFAHAWVERGGEVIQGGLLDGEIVYVFLPKGPFYEQMRIQECTRYSVEEAHRENFRTNHFGPWKPEYAALCGSGGRVHGKLEFGT